MLQHQRDYITTHKSRESKILQAREKETSSSFFNTEITCTILEKSHMPTTVKMVQSLVSLVAEDLPLYKVCPLRLGEDALFSNALISIKSQDMQRNMKYGKIKVIKQISRNQH